MLTRRSLLLGAVCAPAVVRAESLMKIWVPPVREVWVGVDWGAPGGDMMAFHAFVRGVESEILDNTGVRGLLVNNGSGMAMLMRAEEARNREMRAWLEATRISRARIEKDYVTPWGSLFPQDLT